MFLEKYLSEVYYELVLSNYNYEYLESLDEKNFLKIYRLLEKYKFYFIEDIILKYLEIFEMEYNDVEENIIELREKLGNNFVYIIGNDMSYLDDILNY